MLSIFLSLNIWAFSYVEGKRYTNTHTHAHTNNNPPLALVGYAPHMLRHNFYIHHGDVLVKDMLTIDELLHSLWGVDN